MITCLNVIVDAFTLVSIFLLAMQPIDFQRKLYVYNLHCSMVFYELQTLNVGAFEKNVLNKDNGVHMYDTKSLRDVIIQDNKFF